MEYSLFRAFLLRDQRRGEAIIVAGGQCYNSLLSTLSQLLNTFRLTNQDAIDLESSPLPHPVSKS